MPIKNNIELRFPKISDAETILKWENYPEDNHINLYSNLNYSIEDILQHIYSCNATKYNGNELRQIATYNNKIAACIDLTEINKNENSAFVSVIVDNNLRRKKIASTALVTIEKLATEKYNLHTLKCIIHETNTISQKLFLNIGYEIIDKNTINNIFTLSKKI
jgi:RimJ/RimL family protein N-acetyltransferase